MGERHDRHDTPLCRAVPCRAPLTRCLATGEQFVRSHELWAA